MGVKAIRVKLSDGTCVLVKGVASLEELRERLKEREEREDKEARMQGLIDWADDQRDGIFDRHIREAYYEDTHRGGGPGGTEPTGKSKDMRILRKRYRGERMRERGEGQWNENI